MLLFLVALLGASTAPAQAATPAEREANREQLCKIWDTSTTNPEVEIAPDLKISGERIQRIGSSCQAKTAELRILNAQVEELTSGANGTATAQVLAAVTHAAESGELGEGSELFKGAVISRFWVGFDLYTGFYAAGEVRLDWSGGTASYLAFRGTISGLDSFDFKLNSPPSGTVLPNIGGTPLDFTGTLQLRGKRYALDITASAPAITVGEGANKLSITNATVKAKLKDDADGAQRLTADVSGDIAYGDNVKIKGSVSLDFDAAGVSKVTGSGAVDVTIPAKGSSPAGSVKGDATISYVTGGNLLVTFAGDVRFGEVLVAGAKGTLDPLSVTFTGDATVDYKDVQFKGAVEGVAFIGFDLTGRTITNRAGDQVPAKNSDWLVKSASANITAKGLVLSGVAQVGSVGDERWVKGTGSVDLTFQAPGIPETVVKGTASVDWLQGASPKVDFAGSVTSGSTAVANAKGSVDGQKIDFAGDVTLQNPDLKITGAVDGTVYYGADLAGATVKNRAGQDVAATKGDFLLRTVKGSFDTKGLAVNGAATIGRVGGDRWAKGSGSVNVTYGTTKIAGTADVDWVAPGLPSVAFKGRFLAGTAAMVDAEGTVDGNKLTVKGTSRLLLSGFTVNGAAEGVVFYGSDLAGQTITDRSGAEVQAKRGDFLIKSASADVEAQNFALKGVAQVGRVGGVTFAKGGGSVDLTYGATNLKGSVTADWSSGGQPSVGFAGTVTSGTTTIAGASGSFDGKKIVLKGNASFTDPKLSLAGAVEGVVYYGDDLEGETVANRAGVQVPAKKGDFLVKSASGEVAIKNLKLMGDISLSSVGTERWATGGGTVDLTYGATTIKGSAKLAWAQGETPVVSFEGSVASGDTFVGNAKGSIDGTKVTFAGDLKLTNPALSLTGSVTDGVVFYGSELAGEMVTGRSGAQVQAKQGDLYLKTGATADLNTKGFKLTGAAQAGSTGGERWVKGGGTVDFTTGGTTVEGSATAEWVVGTSPSVAFEGSVTQGEVKIASAKGTIDDKKLTVSGDAALVVSGISIKGGASATVYFGSDLSGETVTNAAGDKVPATKGDLLVESASAEVSANGFDLKGKATIGFVGGKLWAQGGGDVDLTYGATNVKGSATAKWAAGSKPTVGFAGTLKNGTTVVAGASGTFDGSTLGIKGDVALTDPRFSLKGAAEGTLYIGDLAGVKVKNRAGAEVQATKGDFVLTSASGEVLVNNLTLKGQASFSSIGAEKWAKGGGSVDLTYQGITLRGNASADWVVGQAPSVSFDGTIKAGDTEVANAKGLIDGKKIVLAAGAQGQATIVGTELSLKGAVSGAFYYAADQTGETVKNKAGTAVQAKQGDFLLDSASATVTVKGLTLVGKASAGSVGGQKWVTGGGSVDFTYNGTNVKGSATADWIVGEQPKVTFEGAVSQDGVTVAGVKGTLDSTKLTFQGQAALAVANLGIKGAVSGAVYLGSDLSGQKIKNAAGADVTPARGDISLDSASAEITAKGFVLTGEAQVGFVGGKLWANGGGSVDLTYGATKLAGKANASWAQGGTPSVSFSGTLTNGTTIVANAAGVFDGKKIAIKGDATLTDPRFTLKGAVDGVLFYGTDLSGEVLKNRAGVDVQPTKGDFAITSASGEVLVKNLTLKGQVAFTSLGTEKWATAGGSVDLTYNGFNLTGSATVDYVVGGSPTVKFKGAFKSGDTEIANASGELDGKKIALSGAATVKTADLSVAGAASGVVYYAADQSGETVKNKAGTAVPATRGDFLITSASAKVDYKSFSLTGQASVGSVGTEKWVTGGGSVDLTYGTVNVKGSATVDWLIGKTPSLTFEGALKNSDVEIANAKGSIDDKKITFSGGAQVSTPNLSVSGSVTGGVLYYGNSLTGETIQNKAGASVQASKGDLRIESASADVTAKGLALKAKVTVGIVGSQRWVAGGGSVDGTYGATNLKGSADFDWLIGQIPSVAFQGTLTNGTAIVANAAGVLDGKKIAIKGDAKATLPNLTVSGAVDGVFFYGKDLTGETVANRAGQQVQPLTGDYLLKNASGAAEAKGLALSGGISIGNVRGDWWATAGGSIDLSFGQPVTRITGSASIKSDGNVAFEGQITNGETVAKVSGTADGQKIVFAGDLSNPMLSGKATGVVYYGSALGGATIVNRAGQTVAANRGDFKIDVTDGTLVLKQIAVSGANASLSKVGTDIWIKGGGVIKIANTPIVFTGEADNTGYANLKGSGSVDFDGTTVAFSGSATIKDGRLVITGGGTLTNGLFSASVQGTIEKPNMAVSQYVLTGTANFKFANFSVANATVRLTFGEGLTTAFNIKSCFLMFICPNATYKLYFYRGTVARAELNAPVAWVAQFLAIGAIAMPGAKIDTKITGII